MARASSMLNLPWEWSWAESSYGPRSCAARDARLPVSSRGLALDLHRDRHVPAQPVGHLARRDRRRPGTRCRPGSRSRSRPPTRPSPAISTPGSPSTVIVAGGARLHPRDRGLGQVAGLERHPERSASRTSGTPGWTRSPTAGSTETTVPANGRRGSRHRPRAAVAASSAAVPARRRPARPRRPPRPRRPRPAPASSWARATAQRRLRLVDLRVGLPLLVVRRRARQRVARRVGGAVAAACACSAAACADVDAGPRLGEPTPRPAVDACGRGIDARLRLADLRDRGRGIELDAARRPAATASPRPTGSAATRSGHRGLRARTSATGTARPSATTPWSGGHDARRRSADGEALGLAPPPNSPFATPSGDEDRDHEDDDHRERQPRAARAARAEGRGVVVMRGPRDGGDDDAGARRSLVREHLADGEPRRPERGQEARDEREDRDGDEPETGCRRSPA